MFQISDEEIVMLIEMSKGDSGADLKALITEAAMMPLCINQAFGYYKF